MTGPACASRVILRKSSHVCGAAATRDRLKKSTLQNPSAGRAQTLPCMVYAARAPG